MERTTITAQELYEQNLSKIKGGFTARIFKNRARKYGLKDTFSEIFYYSGMSYEEIKEFAIDKLNTGTA